jgi:hypothetical protein
VIDSTQGRGQYKQTTRDGDLRTLESLPPTKNKMKKLVITCLAMVSLLLGVSAAIGGQAAPAQAETSSVAYGADANPTGNPIGGGAGYSVIKTSGDYTVTTKAQLLSALASATSGQVVYVSGTASIDMTGSSSVRIPQGVTLASNRGYGGSLGGLIYTTNTGIRYVGLFACASNVTISGLRIQGPSSSTTDVGTYMTGIWLNDQSGGNGYKHLIVENCEVYNWPYSAIQVSNDGVSGLASSDASYVHHNYLHHNRLNGCGYGVGVDGASVIVEANIIDRCRHHVMCDRGTPVSNYEFRYNIDYNTGDDSNCQVMCDAHGGNDTVDGGWGPFPSGHGDPTSQAGGTILIHHNDFLADESSCAPVGIRGIPGTLCDVYNNWTYWSASNTKTAFLQKVDNLAWAGYVQGTYYNMTVHNNWYGTTAPPSTTNQAPVLAAIGNKTVSEGTTLTFTISASDADGDALTYSASNLPQGATFAVATRTFSWTPGYGQSGVYAGVRFQVSDGELTDYEDITMAVNSTLQADVNGDGVVNALDMIRIGQHWGETGVGGWIREDINQDGTVSVLDATLLGQHWTG